jgi:acetoin utilization deacetylase AcuC-like enzyme
VVAPLAAEFAPDIVLVSAGFDAHRDDPLAGMQVTAAGYTRMLEQLRGAVSDTTPIALFLEGGYDLHGLEESVGAALRGLVGIANETPGPPVLGRGVSPNHEREIARAKEALGGFWRAL